MSRGPDPKNTPLTINLEALPTRCCAVGTVSPVYGPEAKRGGYVGWFYDQQNRIMTPAVYHYKTLPDLLINAAHFLKDTSDDAAILEQLKYAVLKVEAKIKEDQEKKRGKPR